LGYLLREKTDGLKGIKVRKNGCIIRKINYVARQALKSLSNLLRKKERENNKSFQLDYLKMIRDNKKTKTKIYRDIERRDDILMMSHKQTLMQIRCEEERMEKR
jgi:hypothetical protein